MLVGEGQPWWACSGKIIFRAWRGKCQPAQKRRSTQPAAVLFSPALFHPSWEKVYSPATVWLDAAFCTIPGKAVSSSQYAYLHSIFACEGEGKQLACPSSVANTMLRNSWAVFQAVDEFHSTRKKFAKESKRACCRADCPWLQTTRPPPPPPPASSASGMSKQGAQRGLALLTSRSVSV